MKLALLVPGGVDRSGVHRVIPCLLWLIERLVRGGDEVHVFALRQEDGRARWPLLGATVHNAGARPRALTMLGMILAEHCAGPFDVIHAFWAYPQGVVGAAASRLLRRPLLLTLPGGDTAAVPGIRYGGGLTWRGRAALRLACRAADAVTVPSGAMQAQARRLGVEADVVPLGVALDRWPPEPPRARDPATPVRLLHVASLNPVKDQETLLRAAAAQQGQRLDFRLAIIGFDTLGGRVQRRAQELGLGARVEFVPALPHAELLPWFRWADLLVMSSLHEAGPLVALEAAVAGVPTVGTAVGHIADFAPDAALAVPVGDSEALAAAIARLAGDEGERLRLAHGAQQRALAIDADFTAGEFRRRYRALASAS